MSSNIKVVVRVRPANHHEAETQSAVVVKPIDENMLIFDPADDDSQDLFNKVPKRRNMLKRASRDMRFAFDCVFDEETSTKEVFDNTTRDIIDGVLEGYNCSGIYI